MCGWRSAGRWFVVVLTACSATYAPPTTAPLASSSAARPAAPTTAPSPSAVLRATPDLRLSSEVLPPELPEFDGKPAELPVAPAGILREPTACRALLGPAPALPREPCDRRDDAVRLLAGALEMDPQRAKRRRALHALERCQGFPPGFVRAVRAELERDCAETLATPLLRRPPPGISAELLHTLRGLALASRFVRAVTPTPVMPEPVDLSRIDAYVAGPLTRFREATAARLEQVALALGALPGQSHGHAVALAGRAVAWHRIQHLRAQTIPDTLKKTYDLRVHYFARVDALSAGFEQRALPYTREATAGAAVHGLLRDRALHEHLSRIYGASKLLWLDLPRATARRLAESPWFQLASHLPARYPAELLTPEELSNAQTLAELAPGGLSLRQKRALTRPAARDDFRTLAELHLKLALVLHRDQEIREASRLADLVEQPTGEDELVLATSRDLLRAADHFETAAAVPADFVPSALLALADDLEKPAEIRAVADYDAAVLMSSSKHMPTLEAAFRRLQAAQDTVSDKVTRDCTRAFQYAIGSSWRFEPVPRCQHWPWLTPLSEILSKAD